MRIRRTTIAFALVITTLGGCSDDSTTPSARRITDQVNTNAPVCGMSSNNTTLGQEFVPKLNSMNFVELKFSPTMSASSSVSVRIWDNAIGGTSLGESPPLTIAATGDQELRFHFDPEIALTPGNRYVLEIVWSAGSWCTFIATSGDPYTEGRLIVNTSQSDVADLWFRTGRIVRR